MWIRGESLYSQSQAMDTGDSLASAAAAATTLNLLRSSTNIRHLRQIHARMIKTQQTRSPHDSGRLVSSLCSHDHLDYALSVFLRISPSPDTFTHNSLLHSLLRHRSPRHPLLFFSRHFPHFRPNSHTFPLLLKAANRLHSLPLGSALHALLLKLSLDSDLHTHTSLLSLYSSLGDSLSVRKLVSSSPHMANIATWNSIISGYVKRGQYNDALNLFRNILQSEEGTKPDEITVIAALTACASLGALDVVGWIHGYVLNHGVAMSVYVGTAMVDAYARCGSIEMAREVFCGMEKRNVMSWTALIRGLAMFGHGEEAVVMFDEMVGSGVEPDDVAFVAVLSACSHSGMVSEGRQVFDEMERLYGIAPKLEHFGCMVDLLSRAGLVDEALDLVTKMPMKGDAALWGCLLSACRRNPTRVELAEYVAGRLIDVEPDNEASYILLSKIYAYNGRWDDVGRVMASMKARGIARTPGCSSVEVDGVVHEFIVGNKSHPRIGEIYEMVEEIGARARKLGHVVDTSEVLLDVEQDMITDSLSQHSERLALAMGLIGTEAPKTIRIVKNLRVCTDCHTVMKLMSKSFGREIILRDKNRFHRFRDGLCTCADFW